MKTCTQRINNIIGQLEGVKTLMEIDTPDCLKIMMQLKAIRAAVSSLMEKHMESEFDNCLLHAGGQKEKLKQIFAEIAKK